MNWRPQSSSSKILDSTISDGMSQLNPFMRLLVVELNRVLFETFIEWKMLELSQCTRGGLISRRKAQIVHLQLHCWGISERSIKRILNKDFFGPGDLDSKDRTLELSWTKRFILVRNFLSGSHHIGFGSLGFITCLQGTLWANFLGSDNRKLVEATKPTIKIAILSLFHCTRAGPTQAGKKNTLFWPMERKALAGQTYWFLPWSCATGW